MLLDIVAQPRAREYLQQSIAIMIDARRMIAVSFLFLIAEQMPGLNGRELDGGKGGSEPRNVVPDNSEWCRACWSVFVHRAINPPPVQS